MEGRDPMQRMWLKLSLGTKMVCSVCIMLWPFKDVNLLDVGVISEGECIISGKCIQLIPKHKKLPICSLSFP